MGLPHSTVESGGGLTSGIFPMVYELMSREPDCNVVDLGATSTGNCLMLSRSGARVYLDTSNDSLRSRIVRGNEITTAGLDKLVARCPKPIDVLLLWDLMDYLSLETIKMVMGRFIEVMREGGLLYTLASRQLHIPDFPAEIEIVREDCLRFLYDDVLERDSPQYAPKQIEQNMPGFVLEKMYLLQNGVQEHLFVFEGPEP